jgi:hypothetical protein
MKQEVARLQLELRVQQQAQVLPLMLAANVLRYFGLLEHGCLIKI